MPAEDFIVIPASGVINTPPLSYLYIKERAQGEAWRLSERTYSAGKAVMAKEWEVFVGKMELEKRTIYMDRMKYKAGDADRAGG